MSRRPKLRLSSNNNIEKQQAQGFEVAAPSEQVKPTPKATEPPPEKIAVKQVTVRVDKTVPQATNWPTGRQFVKVALLVVAAGLSLYLLKRRLLL